ncbi:M48 family metallopeptidase [Halanaerobacter jeridensis]|uniref:Zn-dependent protease with chaperone function n=1 Tax=Halanaerobacter jeridensis TaxID=706427 RepID=A0A938XPD1_9FIRM|nr:M48 family metallopeptidase [Halanaerobacter jeridensis]MBM7556422.1 Zn-dependent protease with chaperone function [Halanaerobacter jeridensis]
MSRKYKYCLTLVVLITLLLTLSYSTVAVSDLEKKISKQNMKLYIEKYGVADLKQEEKEEIDNLFHNLSSEAKKDAPELKFQYRVIDAPVMNAAYLGDGRMILFKGLIEETENNNQLAAIIAHELGHGVNGDIEEKLEWIQTIQLGTLLADLAGDGEINEDQSSQIASIALNLLQKGYSRTQEKDADYYSVFLTKRAGYDHYGAVGVMKLLKRKSEAPTDSELLEIFSEHPNLDKRINYLTELATKVEAADKYYYSPIATARRFTKGLLKEDFQEVYATYSSRVQKQLSLAQFKEQKKFKTVQQKMNAVNNNNTTYQIDLRNQVEDTARVAVLFNKNNNSTLGLALDLKKSNYGWKISNGPTFY